MIAVTLDASFYVGTLNSRGAGSRLLSMALAGKPASTFQSRS